MKKTALFLLAISTAVILSGCKGKTTETEAPTEAPTEAATQAETATETEAPTETEREDSMNKTRTLKALVKSSDGSTLTVQTERGKELSFAISGADIQATGGLTDGSNVTIVYKGIISGTDTSQVTVQMVMDLASGEMPVTEGELMTEAEVADENAGAGTIGGTIEDVNSDRIVITADDGDSYYFSMYEADINLVNGMQVGNYVTVEYNGDIYGPDLVPATSIRDNDPSEGDTAVTPGASASGEYSYINGTLVDFGTTATSITTDDGEELSFDTTTATQCYTDGITAGSYITLEYTGELSGSDTTGITVAAVYSYTESSGDTGAADTADTTADTSADVTADTDSAA